MNKKTEIFDKIDNKDSKEFIAEAVKIYKSYNDDLTKIIKSINKKKIPLMDAIDPDKRNVNSPGIWDYLVINEKKLSYKKNEIELALNFFLYDNEIHNISAKKKKDPCCLFISIPFLPIQPKPLFFAQALSKTGAESTKALALTSPILSSIKCTKSFRCCLITK